MAGSAVASIRVRKETGSLYMDFRWKGVRCREHTLLPDTVPNRKTLQGVLDRINAEITLGTFDYARYFPNSPRVAQFREAVTPAVSGHPLFKDYAEEWFRQMSPEWRHSHILRRRQTLDTDLLPYFGERLISSIRKADILDFRVALQKRPGQGGRPTLDPQTVNHAMTPLRMILTSAADRYEFPNPFTRIKPLHLQRKDIEPLTLEEVKLILDNVRDDFRNYYIVRIFTGLRTGEIDGLKWRYVDFDRRQILVRETSVCGRTEYTKNDGSQREIDLSQIVYDALQAQHKVTGEGDYVFASPRGEPLNHNNVTDRVWYPLLRFLNLRRRRPYQTRHTAATLWLAAGENPEWIARQMGHTTTEMLFRVYSRFVPNLTRRDGSAFEKLLSQRFQTTPEDQK